MTISANRDMRSDKRTDIRNVMQKGDSFEPPFRFMLITSYFTTISSASISLEAIEPSKKT
jgi:hypothetical protein